MITRSAARHHGGRSLPHRLALVVLLVVLLTLFLPGREARACTCAPASPAEILDGGDAAFVGTLVDVERPEPSPGAIISSMDQLPWRFRVETVVAGELPEEVVVMSARDGGSCGLEMDVGERAGVVLYREDGAWSSGLCSKTDPAGLIAAGDPHPPLPAPTATAATERAAAPAGETGPGVWLWLAGLAAAAVIGTGLWALRRRLFGSP